MSMICVLCSFSVLEKRECIVAARPELLRKEVIQPHLPVRLPCYDFALVTSLTFDPA